MHRAGALDRAEPFYRQVLQAEPRNVPSLHMLGFLLGQRQHYDEAVQLLERAAMLRPDLLPVLTHLGHALLAVGRRDEALVVYDRILAQKPDAVDVLYNRSVTLSGMDRAAEALPAIDQALALQPGAAMLHYSRGVMLGQLRRPVEALASYDQALALDPGLALARGNRAMAALNACALERFDAIAAELGAMSLAGQPFAPLTLQGYSQDKSVLLHAARNMLASQVAAPPPLWRGAGYSHERIRIAYVSYDFREHAVANQVAALIEAHDRARFEVIAISTGPDDGSAVRRRLVAAFDRFHDVADQSPDAIARQMQAMEIDIAVDLGGHTHGAPLGVFAHRPAPVAVTWLGYPGTTGADFIDYLVADDTVAPFADQPFFSEKLVHLPDTFFPTDPHCAIGTAPSRAAEGLPDDAFVFCSFNNAWKHSPAVFAAWMRLLAAVPGSVLWLKASNAGARANLEKEAAARGVDPARLVFAKDALLSVHLARHGLADLGLDTLPYNGHATTAHALWAGMPVVSCRGEAFAARVSASLLQAMGLAELVTDTLADYEALALSLARDPGALAALKAKLAQNRGSAALFDPNRFARKLEAAYQGMMDRIGAPESFSVR